MTEPHPIVPTSAQLRGISHPVRVRLLGLLRMDGPQTSADLARATGLNTGATSYHLRQLAQHGFIEDAPDLGSRRERFWRARHNRTEARGPGVSPGSEASLDDQAAWQQTVVTWTAGVVQAAQDEWAELPAPWREATAFDDFLLRLTAAEAAEVVAEVTSLLERVASRHPYEVGRPDAARAGTAPEPGSADGAELWQIHVQAFPAPGRIPHRDER